VRLDDALRHGGERRGAGFGGLLLELPHPTLRALKLLELQANDGDELIVTGVEHRPKGGVACLMSTEPPAQPAASDEKDPCAATHRFGGHELEALDLSRAAHVGAAAGVEVEPLDLDETQVAAEPLRQQARADGEQRCLLR